MTCQLVRSDDDLTNWGGLQEKWLESSDGQWYYLTPKGEFYRWEEPMNGPAGLGSFLQAVARDVRTARQIHHGVCRCWKKETDEPVLQ